MIQEPSKMGSWQGGWFGQIDVRPEARCARGPAIRSGARPPHGRPQSTGGRKAICGRARLSQTPVRPRWSARPRRATGLGRS